MPTLSFNGIDCYYEDHGEGPPVVFLHGAGGNHMSWWQQIPVFSDRYRCITIDHRGFARSTDPRGEGSSRFTDDLEALLVSLEIERAALVAQSMGGRTASAFMLRHPAQVSALVMCDTLGVLVPPDLEARRAELRKERLAAAGESGVLLRGYMAVDFIRNEQARTFLYQTVQGLNPPRDAAAQADSTSREELAAIDTPVLFIVGDEDPVAAPEIVRAVQEAVPGSEYREFAGAGHSVYWEQPDEFNATLGEFLARQL